MTCTEEYREHIEYTFHAFCKVVIRNATINAARTRSRKHKREISLEYLTDEKHYPLGTTDEYFQAPEPDEEYILTLTLPLGCSSPLSASMWAGRNLNAPLRLAIRGTALTVSERNMPSCSRTSSPAATTAW